MTTQLKMEQATQTVIDYMFYNEQEMFQEWMSEEKGRNPKEHIFYSVLIMKYKGDMQAVRTWLYENIEDYEEAKSVIVKSKPRIVR